MPYISKDRRVDLDREIDNLINRLDGFHDFNEGDLNYTITRLLNAAFKDTPRYATINKVVGVLECAKLEFYRRTAGPYEDRKILEHGDVQ